ncbi:MAG: O-antigen ligase family protein [Thiohalomonadales bacterium]|nr:O-antigen ligase family protein [Thiohalomonadales bacterium]
MTLSVGLARKSWAKTLSGRSGVAANDNQVTGTLFGLYIYFLIDTFLHFSARIPGYGHIRPTLVLVLIIVGLLFAQRERFIGRGKEPIFQAMYVLLGYIVISLPLVEYPGSVVKNNLSDFVKVIVFLFFTAHIVDSEKRLKIFLIVFVGCQVFRVLEPLFLHFTTGYWGDRTYLGDDEGFAARLAGAPSDVVNPNGLGFVLVTAIPFLHYLLFSGRWKAKLLYLALMPCLFYALILTMSRGAFLALLVVAWMVFKESSHKIMLILIAIGIALGGWSVMNPAQKDRYISLVSNNAEQSKGVDGRLHLIIHEFELGFERPIVGHGLGTTAEAKFHSWGRLQASHNMYGEVLIELGFIGAVIFLVFIVRIYRRFRENRELLSSSAAAIGDSYKFYSNLNKALIAVFWMYAVYSLNYFGLSQYYWYVLAGLAIAFGRTIESRINASETSSSEQPLVRKRFGLAWKLTNQRH